MFEHILIVCIGNICRSPVAEVLLQQGLAGSGKKISSAGIAAMVGDGADPSSIELMAAKGIDLKNHVARQLDRSMLGQAELILVMEQSHIEAITKMAPEARGKTMLLGKWNNNTEIPDPYKKSTEAFAYSVKLIEQGVASWLKYLR